MPVLLQILAGKIKEPNNESTESRVAERLLPQTWEDLEVFLNSIPYTCLENSLKTSVISHIICLKILASKYKKLNIRYK